MKASEKFYSKYSKAKFERLRFETAGVEVNNLKLLGDKIVSFVNRKTGKTQQAVEYLIHNLDNDRYYIFRTAALSLIGTLKDFEEGSVVSITLHKEKTLNGVRSRYEAKKQYWAPRTEAENEKLADFLSTEKEIFEELERELE